MMLLLFHIQATPAFQSIDIFKLEAMAYEFVLQAKLKYNLRASCCGLTIIIMLK